MPRLGAEPKPPWRAVPLEVRRQTEALLGAPVRRAMRIFGGYAPSATFRLFLGDGRHVVFKGTGKTDNEVLLRAIKAEVRVYEELGQRIRPWAPEYFGSIHFEDWIAIVLEDVGPPQVPPWTARYAAMALRDYSDFHSASLGKEDLPNWLSRKRHHAFALMWRSLTETPDGLNGTAGLAGERHAEASNWLERHVDALRTGAERLIDTPGPRALLHFDTRSDNIRIQPRGRLRIYDWPYACVGPPEFDMVAFAQSITTEGGPGPERCVAWYAERVKVREDALIASIAAIAGYFAHRAWQPPISGLPRVRSIQRRQLRTSLNWAARALELPEPQWLSAVPD
jgi:hypothetical protein